MSKLMSFAIVPSSFGEIKMSKLFSLTIALVVFTPVALAALQLAAQIVA